MLTRNNKAAQAILDREPNAAEQVGGGGGGRGSGGRSIERLAGAERWDDTVRGSCNAVLETDVVVLESDSYLKKW